MVGCDDVKFSDSLFDGYGMAPDFGDEDPFSPLTPPGISFFSPELLFPSPSFTSSSPASDAAPLTPTALPSLDDAFILPLPSSLFGDGFGAPFDLGGIEDIPCYTFASPLASPFHPPAEHTLPAPALPMTPAVSPLELAYPSALPSPTALPPTVLVSPRLPPGTPPALPQSPPLSAAAKQAFVRRSSRCTAARLSYAGMDDADADDGSDAPVLGKRRAASPSGGSSAGSDAWSASSDCGSPSPGSPSPSKRARTADKRRLAAATRGAPGATKFPCSYGSCKKSFTREGDLLRHLHTTLHAGEILEPERRAAIYAVHPEDHRRQYCVRCGHILLRVESLRRHEENVNACFSSETSGHGDLNWKRPVFPF